MKKKVAIVTGGSNGIGKATAELLIKDGYHVIVSDIDQASGTKTVKELIDAGGAATFKKTDVSDYYEVKTLIDDVVKEHGRIDVLVNNAGTGAQNPGKAAEQTLEDWNLTVGVNQSGVFYGMKVALGHMAEQGFGNIVNVASMAGIRGNITGMAYTASKFAVVGMTKSAALEYGSKNIRINCICPGFTDTNLFNNSVIGIPVVVEKLKRSTAMKRVAEPKEMAEAIIWLASDKASYVTGHALEINGGLY